MTHKLGTACIITSNIETFRSDSDKLIGTCTQKHLLSLPTPIASQKLSEKVHQNLRALYQQLVYVSQQPVQLRFFRISSNLLPMFDHPTLKVHYTPELLQKVDLWLAKCKRVIDKYDIRVGAHPDQYTLLDSLREEVRLKSIDNLLYHKFFLERLTTPEQGGVINIHLNGKLGSLAEIDLLKEHGLLEWLTFENSDRGEGDHLCTLKMCQRYGIRYVHDVHHHYVKTGAYLKTQGDDFKQIIKTWRGQTPKFHVSQSRNDEKIISAHSDFIDNPMLVEYTSELLEYGDVMVEAKAKNIAVQSLYNKIER